MPAMESPAAFAARHIGTTPDDQSAMLRVLGFDSRAALMDAIVPAAIRRKAPLALEAAMTEAAALERIRAIAAKNKVLKSFIGQGYYGTHTPGVILRNVLENPAWYTAYTPYQPEISQGRLEALVNYQTMICDLTGMAIANASMLDEATAAAEAMMLCHRLGRGESNRFFVADDVFPQTQDVVRTRAEALAIEIVTGPAAEAARAEAFAVLLQYPGANGDVRDYRELASAVHAGGAHVVAAADLLALTLVVPPGEWGADVVVGSAQRFGVPMGYGGPHAGYLATRDDFKRSMPGRLVGVTIDANGGPAYRLALQTREQHIRREKATSNICTAQVLLAVIAAHVRGVPRPRRIDGDRAPRASADGDPQVGPRTAGPQRAHRALLRHDRRRDRGRHDADRGTRGRARNELPPRRSRHARIVPRRNVDARRRRSDLAGLRRRPEASRARRSVRYGYGRAAGGFAPLVAVSHPPDVQPLSLGNGDAALPAPARRPGHRARPRDDSAGLVHDEAQRDGGNDPGDVAGVRKPSSLRAGRPGGRLRRDRRGARAHALRGDRLRRRVAAAQCRLAGRVRRPPRHQGVPREPRRRPSQRLSHPRVGARDEPCVRANGGNARRRRRLRRERQRRHGRSRGEGARAQREPCRDHGHVSVDPRRVRGGHRPALRDRARARRTGVRRWGEPECARRSRRPRRVRRRRLAPQSAQDVLHPARRRRPGRRSDRRRRASRPLPAGPPLSAAAPRGDRVPSPRHRKEWVPSPRHLMARRPSCRSRGCTS